MTPQNASATTDPKPTESPELRVHVSLATMMAVVLVVASHWLLIRLLPVLLVVIAALFLAATLSPVIEWLEARRMRRSMGIGIVFTALFIVTGLSSS